MNHPDNEEHAETPRRRNVASFSGVDSPNQEGGKFSRPRSAAVAPMITHFSGSSPTSASTPPISSLPCDAGRLKRQLDQAAGYIPGSYKKAKGDLDPENHEIYKLRQTNMTFEAVAKKINTMRAKAGKVGDLTANAVYARYKRNAPLISAAKGEKFQLCELDENMGTLAALAEAKNTYTFDPTDDILLVRAYSDVMADTWKLVSQRVQELGGQYHEPELCARRYGHL